MSILKDLVSLPLKQGLKLKKNYNSIFGYNRFSLTSIKTRIETWSEDILQESVNMI